MSNLATIKLLSKRLFDATDILDAKYTDIGIIDIIKTRDQEIKLSRTYFSKLKLAYKNKKYAFEVNERIYNKIFSVLDLLLEEDFGAKWREDEKKYIIVQAPSDHKIKKISNTRIAGFVGTWIGYSFNKTASEQKKVNYYNIYKLEITQEGKVNCETKNGIFVNGKIEEITSDRVFITLEARDRKVALACRLGAARSRPYNELRLAYVDTGNDNVKCGITIIKKTEDSLSLIEIGSQPRSHFDGHPHEFIINLLPEHSQIISDLLD